jgi:cytochrome P450
VWLLLYILCDTSLAKELTNEISKVVTRKSDQVVLDISVLSQECPLLISAYQQTLRLQNVQTGTRVAMEDTVLTYTPSHIANSAPVEYLIPKGAMVQMPSGVLHKDTKTWGSDALEFNPRRFLKNKTSDVESNQQEKQQRRAYNPFGGGKHLCPGRHFAFAEILATVAMLLLGFDIVAPEGMSLTVPE